MIYCCVLKSGFRNQNIGEAAVMPDPHSFSDRLKKVIALAKEESQRLGHNFIGSEQLLVGLLSTDGTAQILNEAGVNLEAARASVEKVIGRGSGFLAAEIPFTPKAKRAIEMAMEVSCQRLVLVQPEHLLLGVLDTGEATALKILENLGVSISQLRMSVLTQIQQQQQVPAPQQDRGRVCQTSLLPAIPPVKSDAPRSLYATVLPQETGRWVAEVSTSGSGLGGPSFRSIGYGDTEYQAIADALESVARMYRDYRV